MVREEPPDTLKEAMSWEDPFDTILEIVEVAHIKEDYSVLRKYEIYAIHTNLLDSEVYNGGFHQFFRNKSGDYALEILVSLREIGSKHIALLLDTAIAQFPDFNDVKVQEKRLKVIQRMQETDLYKWRELSQEYYQSSESIYDLVIRYIHRTYNI